MQSQVAPADPAIKIPFGWSPRRAFWIVFLFGTVLRLIALVCARDVPFVSDAHEYVDVARLLLSGQHFVPYWPSGFPLFLLPFVAAGAPDVVLRAVMLFWWAAAAWGIWRLARGLGLAGYAWVVLLAFALMPASIQMSTEPLTQQPVAALLLIALGSAALCIRGAGMGEFMLLGIALGWMGLTRPSALALLLLLPAGCLWVLRRRAGDPNRVRGPVVAVVLGAALVGGWIVRAHQLSGAWIINNSNAANLYFGNNPWTPMYRTWYFGSSAKIGTPEIHEYPEFEQIMNETLALPRLEASAQFKRMAVEYIQSRPDLFALRTFNRMRCFFGFPTFTSANLRSSGEVGSRLFPVSLALEAGLYLAVVGWAFFWLAAAPGGLWRQWQSWLLAGAVVVYAFPYWLSMSHPTYNYPVVMPLALLGLFAWRWTVSSAKGFSRVRGWIAVAVFAAIQVEWVIVSLSAHGVGN